MLSYGSFLNGLKSQAWPTIQIDRTDSDGFDSVKKTPRHLDWQYHRLATTFSSDLIVHSRGRKVWCFPPKPHGKVDSVQGLFGEDIIIIHQTSNQDFPINSSTLWFIWLLWSLESRQKMWHGSMPNLKLTHFTKWIYKFSSKEWNSTVPTQNQQLKPAWKVRLVRCKSSRPKATNS